MSDEDPGLIHYLGEGRWAVPDIPLEEETPCRNEDVTDLWFGVGWGGQNAEQALDHAAMLCNTVCRVRNPEAFAACREYAVKYRPAYGVWGGIKPRRWK